MVEIKSFDIKQTNIAKGIALLLLLWHHIFFNNPEKYNNFLSLKIIGGVPIECIFSNFAKVCVAIFLFLSGYGMFKSISSYENRIVKTGRKFGIMQAYKYSLRRFISLMSEYWFVFIVFVPLGFVFGRSPLDIYGNAFEFIGDFFGVSAIYNGATMNATWWYMSLIIIIIFAFPIIYMIFKKLPYELLMFSLGLEFLYFFPNPANLRIYLFPFILGMVFAKENIFDKICEIRKHILSNIFIIGIMLIISLYYRTTVFKGTSEIDAFITIPVILFSFLVLSKIPVVNKVLEQLGKYSGSIFMFHTFIFSYYFHDFIYSFKYSLIIFIVMVVVCYIIAVILELLKKLIRYDKLVNLICSKI